MKKLLSMIIVSGLATGYAGKVNTTWDSFETETRATLSDGSFASTDDGYIVTYWWSGPDGELKALGANGLMDLYYGSEYEGYIFWDSPSIIESLEGDTGSLAIRIFQVEDMAGSTSAEWQAYLDTLNATIGTSAGSVEFDNLWENAIAGSSAEVGEWIASYTAIADGIIPEAFANSFKFPQGQPLPMDAVAVPEASTYAMAFGAAALAFAACRRRK